MRNWTAVVLVSTQRKYESIIVEHIKTDGNNRYLAEEIAIAKVMLNEKEGKKRYLKLEDVSVWSEDRPDWDEVLKVIENNYPNVARMEA